MEGEYSQEWSELRRLRRQMFRVAAAGAVILVAVPLVTKYVSLSAAKIIGLVLFAAWVVVLLRFFFVSSEYVYWSCPMRQALPLSRALVWQMEQSVRSPNSDPDPKLKRKLDPFRGDSLFKLGQ